MDYDREKVLQEMLERYQTYPAKIREMLETRLRPRYADQKEGILEKVVALEERLKLATTADVMGTENGPPLMRFASGLYQKASIMCATYIDIDEMKTGVLYRINCRNSNSGIWVPDQGGFEIARTKFDSTFLFVEYHWDRGPPFGTARPLEILEDLPEFETDEARLTYLTEWRDRLYKEAKT